MAAGASPKADSFDRDGIGRIYWNCQRRRRDVAYADGVAERNDAVEREAAAATRDRHDAKSFSLKKLGKKISLEPRQDTWEQFERDELLENVVTG